MFWAMAISAASAFIVGIILGIVLHWILVPVVPEPELPLHLPAIQNFTLPTTQHKRKGPSEDIYLATIRSCILSCLHIAECSPERVMPVKKTKLQQVHIHRLSKACSYDHITSHAQFYDVGLKRRTSKEHLLKTTLQNNSMIGKAFPLDEQSKRLSKRSLQSLISSVDLNEASSPQLNISSPSNIGILPPYAQISNSRKGQSTMSQHQISLLKSLSRKPPILPSLSRATSLSKISNPSDQCYEWNIPGIGAVKFIDHMPEQFRQLRVKLSFALSDVTSELSNALESCLSQECENLKTFLYEYTNHLEANQNSLLPKFLGLYTFERVVRRRPSLLQSRRSSLIAASPWQTGRHTFLLTVNLFLGAVQPHLKFDFKGSSVGRQAFPQHIDLVHAYNRSRLSEAPNSQSFFDQITLKETDWKFLYQFGMIEKIDIGQQAKLKLLGQLRADTDLLRRYSFMDYSLLVGIYENVGNARPTTIAYFGNSSTSHESFDFDGPSVPSFLKSIIGNNMYQKGVRSKGKKPKVYFFCLIDTLQTFTLAKWIEKGVKSGVMFSRSTISEQTCEQASYPKFTARTIFEDIESGSEIVSSTSRLSASDFGEPTTMEVSVEEPGRYAERLIEYIDSICV